MSARLPPAESPRPARVAVVIPCYRVERHIEEVIRTLPAFVSTIVIVDDKSPDQFVDRVQALRDPRVVLLRHDVNQGVGGAMITGYRECLKRDPDVVVKMDGDGQMDPAHLLALISPLLHGQADYTKGNRWFDLEALVAMPWTRRIGSMGLSFLTKAATGFWSIFDPCNGYTAIRTSVLRRIPLDRVARNFFFESSMLLHLGTIGAVVKDVPTPALYGTEVSTMHLRRVLLGFPPGLLRGGFRRVWLRHFVRDFSQLSVCLTCGVPLMSWGLAFSSVKWLQSILTGVPATSGTVMVGALPFLLGFQLLLQATQLDVAAEPREPHCKNDPLDEPITPISEERSAA
jgi:dolichol-phosphate mannosyltransferase